MFDELVLFGGRGVMGHLFPYQSESETNLTEFVLNKDIII